jgi:hypothetical protein
MKVDKGATHKEKEREREIKKCKSNQVKSVEVNKEDTGAS